jgi:hypothetical protein
MALPGVSGLGGTETSREHEGNHAQSLSGTKILLRITGEGFLRLRPDLLAELQVNTHGLAEFLFESRDGVGLKRDPVPRIPSPGSG